MEFTPKKIERWMFAISFGHKDNCACQVPEKNSVTPSNDLSVSDDRWAHDRWAHAGPQQSATLRDPHGMS